MGTTGQQDWTRLGRMLRQARIAAGIKRQSDLAAAVGLSTKTIGNYERGREPDTAPTVPDGYHAVATRLGWAPGSVERVLAGGDPQAAGDRPSPTLDAVEQLVEETFQLMDAARDMGAPPEVVSRCRLAVTELVAWMTHQRGGSRGDYGLAAYRPHALGEGVESDDAERIFRAMNDN